MRNVIRPGIVVATLAAAAASTTLPGCSTSPDAPDSYATFSAAPTARFARAVPGFVSYGAPYHSWKITLSTTSGCAGDDQVTVEIDTLSGVTDLTPGTIPFRTTQTTIATVPSAYLLYTPSPGAAGSITIETFSPSFVTGSFTAGALTASFGAIACN